MYTCTVSPPRAGRPARPSHVLRERARATGRFSPGLDQLVYQLANYTWSTPSSWRPAVHISRPHALRTSGRAQVRRRRTMHVLRSRSAPRSGVIDHS